MFTFQTVARVLGADFVCRDYVGEAIASGRATLIDPCHVSCADVESILGADFVCRDYVGEALASGRVTLVTRCPA